MFSKNLNEGKYFESMVHLWHLGDEAVKVEVQAIIEKYLDGNFNADYFRLALNHDISSEKRFMDESLKSFCQMPHEVYKTVKEGKPIVRDEASVFIQFVYELYRKGIKIDEKSFERIESAPNYVKFFLFPKLFDYSKFDPLWLLFYDPNLNYDAVVYKSLSKIKEVKKAVKESLKEEYNNELAMVYNKYML